jgi:creatinine amidohydrolase
MLNEYDEVYTQGVAKGGPRLCTPETGAALADKLRKTCARFAVHFAGWVKA